MSTNFNELIQINKTAHLLYAYNGMENYIENAVAFIKDGVVNDQSIILIENEKYLPFLMEALKKHLTDKQMTMIHLVNNFDFYFSSGSYHPPAILEYIEKTHNPLIEKDVTFRTWTHVEWSTIEGPLSIVEELEKAVDRLVSEMGLVVMCAYEEEGMPDTLKSSLLRTHKFILTDDEVLYSELYEMEHLIK